jgi:hypothetical protein
VPRWPAITWEEAFPESAKLWSERNEKLPSDYLRGATDKVWWKCPAGLHPDTFVSMRDKRRGSGCPYCASVMIAPDESLAALDPDLAQHWSERNQQSPGRYRTHSPFKAWWRCPAGAHEDFQRTIAAHIRIRTCPRCAQVKASPEYCLATIHPDIARDWSERNDSEPTAYLPVSGQAVWWKCREGVHEDYERRIVDQVAREGRCRYCTGYLGENAAAENSLATVLPGLAAEWSPRNDVQPSQVGDRYSKRVLWSCAEGHPDYEATVTQRRQGRRCPICSGVELHPTTSLAAMHPDLAAQWSSRNDGAADQYRPTHHRALWWTCEVEGHDDYSMTVAARVGGRGCPVCASLGAQRADLAEQWAKRNEKSPFEYAVSSGRKAWWLCPTGEHPDYLARIADRSAGSGCPYCSGNRVTEITSLARANPQLAERWSPHNDIKPTEVTRSSTRKVWWLCPTGEHPDYLAQVSTQSRGSSCPYCSGNKVCESNCLATTHPDIAAAWSGHNDRSPSEVTAGSNYTAWWICPVEGHGEYRSVVATRVKTNSRCPYCTGQKAHPTTCLAALHPDLAAEWHPDNDRAPSDVTVKSGYRARWQCLADPQHPAWTSTVAHRTSGSGCPACNPRSRSIKELRIAFELAALYGADVDDTQVQGATRAWRCDLVLRRERIIVEYDGMYYHRGRAKHQRDRRKTADLEAAGWQVLRIRERPLRKLAPHDVTVSTQGGFAGAREATVKVLQALQQFVPLDPEVLARYLALDGLANMEAAEQHIAHVKRRRSAARQ